MFAFGPARAADAGHPIVVELFQSQGCSSCPPANANVLAIADRPDVLALSWQVTYWDYLGWKDTFAADVFTQRQYAYARALGNDGVFTPQIVVNGRVDGAGMQRRELDGLIAQGERGAGGPSLNFAGDAINVGAAPGAGQVLLVQYDPNIVQVAVKRGENAGETLPHRNVVRHVSVLGQWDGTPARFTIPRREGLRNAILIQAANTGPILAATHD